MSKETIEEVDEFKNNHYFKKQVMNPFPVEGRAYTAYSKGFTEGYEEAAKWQAEQDIWKTVSEETPPIRIELLVQSPSGVIHLANWRPAYNIFTCQEKSESSFDWKWKLIIK